MGAIPMIMQKKNFVFIVLLLGLPSVLLAQGPNIQWQKCLGGDSVDVANSVIQTSDGGYAIAGYTYSSNGNITSNHGATDVWVVKLDAKGNIEWQRTLGGSSYEEGNSIIEGDNGFVIAGHTTSNDGDVSGFHDKD